MLFVVLQACDDELKPVDLIEEPRVLAARIEVEGDPQRASPSPGETAHVTWLVATPSGDAFSGFALGACSALPRRGGLSNCREAPFKVASAEPSSDRPRFDFTVPAELDPSAAPLLAIQGSLCPESSGSFEGEQARCADGPGLRVNLDFLLATPDDVNQNPSFPADSITLDGAVWPLRPISGESCAGLGFPELAYTSAEHALTVSLPDSARQALVQKSSADPKRESLQIAHFASAGNLTSAFSNLLEFDPANSVKFGWTAPKDVPAEGRLVRFWFVARDGRGGSDFTERALCALP
jgi:hypothetical protein